jgi:aspartate/methionine/tyrosine aminotransferase
MQTMITRKALTIPPFIVMEVMERAGELEKEGRHIIHLEIGEPDFGTPSCICDAAREAMIRGQTHYTHSLGILPLREAICTHYQEKYGVHISPEQVIVTSGTSPALLLLFCALLDPGDEIILSDPHYPCYPNYATFLDARPVFVKGEEKEGFQLNPEEIKKKIGRRARAVLINSPGNPTGNLLSPERMEAIARLGLPVISDEIYHGLVYGQEEHTILEYTDNAFVLNGFSKLYAMTGWRLGYVIAPRSFVRPLQKLQQNFFISAGSISQWGGLAALTCAERDVMRMREIYDERRRYMIKRIRALGFGLPVEPVGAFYVFANAKEFGESSYGLAFEILEKAGVGVSPGIDFGKKAEGFLRFSYASSLDNIKTGLDRIEDFFSHR